MDTIGFAKYMITLSSFALVSFCSLIPKSNAQTAASVTEKLLKYPTYQNMELDTSAIMKLIKDGEQLFGSSPDSSLRYYKEAFALSNRNGFTRGSIKSLNNIGLYHFSKKDYDKSISSFVEALQYNNDKDSVYHKGRLFYNLALCYGRKGQYQQGIALLNQALVYGKDNRNEKELLLRIYSELGVYHQYQGAYEAAASYYFILLSQATPPNANNYSYALDAYNRLGVIQLQLKLYDKALLYFRQGEHLARTFRDTGMLAKIVVNKGALYAERNEKDKAEKNYLEAYEMARLGNHEGVQQTAGNNLAKLLVERNDPQAALPYAEEAMALGKDSPNQDTRINTGYTLGYIYYKMKQYKKAEKYLLNAQKEMLQKGLIGNALNAHEVLANVYAATGQYKKAFEQEQAYVQMNDSLRGKVNAIAVNELEAKYQLAQKNSGLAEQHLKITTQQSQLKENRLWLGGTALALLLLTTTLIGLYRSNRHKQKLQTVALNNLLQQQELIQLRAQAKGEEKERKRIAGELHDGIASQLYALKMNVVALRNRESGKIELSEIDHVLHQLDEAGKEIRTTAHNLVPDLVLREGLNIAVAALCEKIERNTQLDIDFQHYGVMPRLDPIIELSIYRMIQELIQNTMKHAAATHLLVQLSCENSLLNITVEDNGIGLHQPNQGVPKGSGLASIAAKMPVLNGSMDIKSIPNKGTAIYLEFDIKDLTLNNPLYKQ